MIEKLPDFFKKRQEEREEIRGVLPPETQLKYPEKSGKKLGVPASEILKKRKSQEIQDQFLIETIRKKIREKLGKEVKEEDRERLEKLKELAEEEKKKLIYELTYFVFYANGMESKDQYVREATASTLGELAKVSLEKAFLLYQRGIEDKDYSVREATASTLGELAKVSLEKAFLLYQRGIEDKDSSVRRATASTLGELAKVSPEKAFLLYQRVIEDGIENEYVACALGKLIQAFNFTNEKKISDILTKKYKIPDTEIIYTYQILINLLKEKKDLSELIFNFLPEKRTIEEFSEKINNQLPEDKKTTSVGEFWQKNQSALVNLQCLDLNLSTQLIRQNLRLFGFPRLERFLNTANFVLSFPKFKDSLKEIVKRTQDIDAEFFSRLINLSDAFIRMGFKEDFEEEMNSLLTKKNLLAQEVIQKLGERLLKRFVKKIGVKTQTIQTEVEKWNLEYLSKLFEAEKQFKEEDRELLKLIIKLEFQERSFKEAILDNYQREYYTPNEKEWLEEIKEYAQRVQREFQENGIDFEKWYHYQKRKEFTVGPSPEVQREKRESFFREFQEVVINLLGSWQEKKKGLLSQDKAKEVFNKVFKKYGIQLKEGEFYHPQKGKLDLREIESVLKDFVDLIEKFYQEEKDQKVKEQIGTNLSHLQDLKNRLGDLSSELKRRGYRLLIKPWERNPGYDIFQGNYTHCCIAVENFNRGAILDYLIDFGLQVIEVKDTAEDKTIAQTSVYFTQDIQGEINLVLDNIEINSEYAGLAGEIRENLFAYLKEFALDVCPKTKRILLGTAYNDVETTDLEKRNLTLSKIGGSPRKTEYLDAFGCVWVDPSIEINKTFHLVGEGFIQKREIKRRKKKYITETIEEMNEEILRGISRVEELSFPPEMQSNLEDLRETLEDKEGIQIITREEGGEIVSYLSSKPLEKAYEQLRHYDPELKPEEGVLYVESIATIPESRDVGIFLRTLNTLKEKARERGYKKIAAHVRVQNNLSSLLQKKGARKIRTIENWHNFGEPFDYLEIEV